MTTPLRLATAAVIGVLAIGGGFLLLRGPLAQVGHPGPSPSSWSTEIQGQWVSVGTRTNPDVGGQEPAFLIVRQGTLEMTATFSQVTSSWSEGPEGLDVRLAPSPSDRGLKTSLCGAGDLGAYGVSVAPDGGTMTLTPIRDACGTRAQVLAGSWTRALCTLSDGACLPSQPPLDPTAIQANWVSVGGRVVPGTTAVAGPEDLAIDTSFVALNGLKGWIYSSWSLAASPNRMAVRLASTYDPYWFCQVGQEGTYALELSADLQTLSLSPVSDACATRSAILAGDWARQICPSPGATPAPQCDWPGMDPSWRPGG